MTIYSLEVLLFLLGTSLLFHVQFCCFLTCIQVSQEVGQVVWYSHLFQNFLFVLKLQFIFSHFWGLGVKGQGVVWYAPPESLRGSSASGGSRGPFSLHTCGLVHCILPRSSVSSSVLKTLVISCGVLTESRVLPSQDPTLNHTCKDPFSWINSHSHVLGFRTWTYHWEGVLSTHYCHQKIQSCASSK